MEEARSPHALYDHRRQSRSGQTVVRRSPWKRRLFWGIITLTALIVIGAGIFLWYIFTRVTLSQATVHGAVISLSPEVTARTRELCVHPGDHITKGQVLIRLDGSGLEASLSAARSVCRQEAASLCLSRTTVAAEIELAKARVAEATAARDEAKARLSQLKKGPRHEEIEIAKVRVGSATAEAKLAAMELTQSEQLLSKGVDSPFAVETMKTALESKKNLQREAELTLEQLLAGATTEELDAAANTLAAREASLDICRAQLKQAEARQFEVTLQSEKVKAEEANVVGAEAAASKTVIESPVDGTVILTSVRVGELCRAGAPAIMVADDSAGWWLEGFVRDRDAAQVRVGQRASMEIVDGRGTTCRGTVAAVGLATSAMRNTTADSAGSSTTATNASAGQLVWVKLTPVEPKNDPPLLGISARATIIVR